MPFEGGEYDGEEINDRRMDCNSGRKILIYENEHLPLDEQTKETVKVEWEDGSVTENNRDEIFG